MQQGQGDRDRGAEQVDPERIDPGRVGPEQVDPGQRRPSERQAERDPERTSKELDGGQRPDVVLDKLADDLQKADAEAQATRQKFEALQADINALKKANDDLDKAVQQYAQAKGNLDQQLQVQKDYEDENGKVIKNAVDDAKDLVDAAWDQVKEELTALCNQRDEYREALDKATDEYTNHEREVRKAREKFDKLKGRLTDLQQRLKVLGDLQKRIETAQREPNPIKMYVLLREFHERLKSLQDDLLVVKSYRTALYDAWSKLNDAQTGLRTAAKAKTEAQQNYDNANADYEKLESGRVEAVLRLLPAQPADE
jgi:chromosome segregation ATPase